MMALALAGTFLALLLLVAVPIILVGALIGAVFYLVAQLLLLPFRLLGWTVAAGLGAIFLLLKFFLLLLLGILAGVLLIATALPLVPLALLGAGIWFALRASRGPRNRSLPAPSPPGPPGSS